MCMELSKKLYAFVAGFLGKFFRQIDFTKYFVKSTL